MSFRLAMILPQNIDEDLLEQLREKYNLGLIKIENEYANYQLWDDEQFFQATKTGFDDLAGIGAFDLYNQDIAKARGVFEKNSDKRTVEFLINEYLDRRKEYKKDAERWIEIIKAFRNEFKIDTIGIFSHMYETSFEKEKIDFKKREYYRILEITFEDLMKIKLDELVFFD